MKRVVIIVLLSTLFSLNILARESRVVVKGVVDLTDWYPNEGDIVSIHGKWEFYWNELLEPDDFADVNIKNPIYVTVPGIWNKDTIPAHGYGTYRLLVKVKNNECLDLKISSVSTSYKLWINKKLICEVGKVGESKEQYKPKLEPKTYLILPDSQYIYDNERVIEFILQVSNYYHVNSGIWESVELGSYEKITRSNEKSNLFISIIIGALLIMALYHFVLFYLRRDEFSVLYFGIFLFVMAIRAITTNNRLIIDIFPNINFQLLVRLEYLSAYTNIIFASLFFYSLFKTDVNKIIIKSIAFIGLVISLIIILTPMNFFTSLRDVFNLFALLSGIYITFIALVKAMINKRLDSVIAFVGMFFLFMTGVVDILTTVMSLPLPYMAPYGLVFYVLLQSFILSKRYSLAFSENKDLTEKLNYHNKNLEEIIEKRTLEINRQKKVLEDSEFKLKENIEELATIEEELRQNNETLHVLNNDIEEQKKIIEQKEKRLKKIIDNQGDGFAIINLNKEFVFVNRATEEIFEVGKGELLGNKLNIFLDDHQCEELFGENFENIQEKRIIELDVKLRSGKNKHLQITQTFDYDDDGKLVGLIGIIRDVTKLKNTELEIIEKNRELNRYFVAIEQSSATIVFTSIKGDIEYVNPQFTKLTGYTFDEVIGKNPRILKSNKLSREFYRNMWKTIANGNTWEGEFINLKKDGTEFIERAIISPIKNNKGKTVSYVAIKEDITKEKELKNKMLELLKNTEKQKQIIENAHSNIMSSIEYAKGIQNALLPMPEIMDDILQEYFILFNPKDAVSGDFYYVNKVGDTIVFSAADCTGHGVPGAFMTILSITFLNEIIRRERIIIPSDILEQLRFRIKGIFTQFGRRNNNGLDIVLCSLDKKTNILQYAGANNPLFIVRDGEILEYKPTRAPIGEYPKLINFENVEIQLKKNDVIYLTSDGYQDQFGGSDKKKFSKKHLKELLVHISELPMNEQKQVLESTINHWMGKVNSQIDDMVIMGVKV